MSGDTVGVLREVLGVSVDTLDNVRAKNRKITGKDVIV